MADSGRRGLTTSTTVEVVSWVCNTCGNEYPDAGSPPASCIICTDDRQFVPQSGQRWHRLASGDTTRDVRVRELEEGLTELTVVPSVGIGQRTFVVRGPAGNVLFEPPGYLSPQLIDRLDAVGGVAAIASSHPHLVGASVSLSHRFGRVPVWFNDHDRRWATRLDPVLRWWSGHAELPGGVRLIQCGGHFPGSAVLHFPSRADGRGVLLTGDTVMVGADRASVSFMRSFPNMIPLPPRLVRGIVAALRDVDFDRMYSGFGDGALGGNAHQILRDSAERYIGWITDQIRDPDDPDPGHRNPDDPDPGHHDPGDPGVMLAR